MFFAILVMAIAVVWLAIGYAFLFYPREIARYNANYIKRSQDRALWPFRVVARPLVRYIESPANIRAMRVTGIVWIAMGVFMLYFLRFA